MQDNFMQQPLAIVIADDCRHISEHAIIGFENYWEQQYDFLPDIDVFDVPSVSEIPWQCSKLVSMNSYSLIIALGLVTKNESYINEHLVTLVNDGIMRVSIESALPIIARVFAVREVIASDLHVEFYQNEFQHIGEKAVNSCRMLLENLSQLED